MKYSAVALAAFVAVASAQSLSDIPECAIPCIEAGTTKSTKCAIDDYKCICGNIEAIVPAATTCVLEECGNAVALNEVLPATEKFCAAVEAGGDDAPASSAAPESSAPAPSSSAPAETSSEAPAASSAAPSAYPTSLVSSVTPSAEPSSTSTATSTTSVAPVITAGAANIAGSLGLLVLGAVAAL
ncbi:hypothetical protein QBC37DRAFT_21983 [Rhypophila decipiens]|uniref:CFEM domain-containing protein n=1 Tax=Rhypophila decipiens TaxID=261697 RepID=A0AAN7B4W9_9PEZI|nr:hypothetical protein QBC37DRAFT_21983 [Rhypophila decipiens]